MLRSTLAFALTVAACPACTRTSDSPPLVTAPIASGAPGAAGAADAAASPPPAPASSGAAGTPADGNAGAAAQFRVCHADAECVAVARVGCCHNGWMEAVSASQKDAYAQSFVCPQPRPMCPMYIVRDARAAKCDLASHLCTMVGAQP